MICPNCRNDVTPANGYCPVCGTNVNMKVCPNGHVMDPSWDVCPYCPQPQGQAPGGYAPKGGTLVEGAGAGPAAKGGTMIESAPSGKGRTVAEEVQGSRKKMTVIESPRGAAGSLPRMVGWLVSFTWDPSGKDYRVREGKNVIGASANEADILISNDSKISGKHATLIYRKGRFLLGDEHSMNGTYVNGEDISEVNLFEISDNDVITIGDTELKFKAL